VQVVRRQLRRLTWVALFALLGLLFGSLQAHAALPVLGDICSTAHASGGGPQPADGLPGQHCPLCVHHGSFAALPGSRMAALPSPAGVVWRPGLALSAALPHANWLAPAPRGPPAAA
jgi:hypothetical protein